MRALRWISTLLVLVVTWGVAVEPRFVLDLVSLDVVLPNLPPALDGMRVGVIGDLQLGMWLGNTGMARHAVSALVERRPDVVVIAGDFVYNWSGPDPDAEPEDLREELHERADDIRESAQLLAPLVRTRIPVVAVLGNHDYGMMWPDSRPWPLLADTLERELEHGGVVVLRNEAVRVDPRGLAPLYIAGVDARLPHADDARRALQQVPANAARIVLMHNPASFAELPPHTAPLAIAAHTHGGQVRLPFLPRWSWLTLATDAPVHADGWIHGYGQPGNRLYVNRGIGFSTVPVRINCPPEVTVFTLRSVR